MMMIMNKMVVVVMVFTVLVVDVVVFVVVAVLILSHYGGWLIVVGHSYHVNFRQPAATFLDGIVIGSTQNSHKSAWPNTSNIIKKTPNLLGMMGGIWNTS